MATQTTDHSSQRARKIKYGANAVIGAVLMVVFLVAANYVARIKPGRLDLTRGKQYTTSAATERLLAKLTDTVTINVYASTKDTPADWKRQREDLAALLAEFRQRSGKKINFTFKDPSDPKIEEEAQKIGIEPQTMSQVGTQSLSIAKGYLGLVVQYRGKSEPIPVLKPNSPLEYQLTRVINKVAQLENPTVAIVAPEGNPMAMMQGGGGEGPYTALPQVLQSEGYTVKTMSPERLSDLTTNTQMMFVLNDQPVDFSEEALFRIDQFVMRGGKLFVGIGGIQIQGGGRQGPMRATAKAPNINSILDYYGLRINPDLLEDWERGAVQQTLTNRGPVAYREPLIHEATDVSKDNDITKYLPGMVLLYPSSVSASTQGTSGTIVTLAKTSNKSRKQDGMFVIDPLQLSRTAPKKDEVGLKSYDLMAMVKGKLNSRFANVDPPVVTEENGTTHTVEKKDVLTTSKDTAEVIVVGTGVSFTDQVLSRAMFNAVLLQNVADAMVREGAFTSLRAKQQNLAPLREISDREKFWAQVLIIGLMPVLVTLFGIGKATLNARRRARYRRMYGPKSNAATEAQAA